MSKMNAEFKIVLGFLVTLATVSALDFYSPIFSYVPYSWLAALGSICFLLSWSMSKKLIVGLIAVVSISWLAVLPTIEWTTLKQFKSHM